MIAMRIKTEYLRGVALLSEFAINPVAFLEKMALKLPQYSGILAALKHALTSLVSAELRELLIIRDFDAALRITPRWNPILASWLKREIRELERPVLPSIPQAGLSRRVLYLATNSWPYTNSGYALRTQKVAATLHAQGLDIIVVTRLGYPFVVGKRVNEHDESIDGVQYRRMVTFWGQLTSTARFERAAQQLERVARETSASEILCTTDFRNAQLASYVAERLGIPWTYEVRGEAHNTWLSTLPEPLAVRARRGLYYSQAQRLEREAVCAARGVAFISKQAELFEWAKTRALAPMWVPNGVDEAVFEFATSTAQAQSKVGIPKGIYVGAISSVVPYEGLDILIRAVPRLPREVSVLIVGGGTALNDLVKLAFELGVRDRVVFAGPRVQAEILWWYACLEVFVMPRRDLEVTRNVTPVKGLTAQALGIPVVASEIPALREVTDGTAFYFAPGDVEGLASAIQIALESDGADGLAAARARVWSSTVNPLKHHFSKNSTPSL